MPDFPVAPPAPFEGVFAAVLTPLLDDLAADEVALAAHCHRLLAQGCDGLSLLGTTGEANSFSLNERIRILEAVIEAGIPPARLMPGTGCCSITETTILSKRAVELGCAGVLMGPPFYYKNVSDEGIHAAFSEVIQRVGDGALRIYLYHFPQMSAVPLSLDLIESLLKDYPVAVAGMKDSSGDLNNMTAAAKAFPGFRVFSGADDLLLPLLKAGGAGCITAISNISAPLAAEVLAKWRTGGGDAAHTMLCKLRRVITAYPISAALKEIMARHSGDGSWRTIRPPLVQLNDDDARALHAALASTGYGPPPL
ncbi:MAG TPA: dihydrodipicolinate synthase family protein [Alphaproteobacteria bacterium]|nr:dihydrodipicolinate synthase family protein [Alphaproteobacteria bacterium]